MITLLALPQPGPPPTGASAAAGLPLEQLAERQPEHRRAADAQQIAPRNAKLTIAQVFAGLTRDDEHFRGRGLGTGGLGKELVGRTSRA